MKLPLFVGGLFCRLAARLLIIEVLELISRKSA